MRRRVALLNMIYSRGASLTPVVFLHTSDVGVLKGINWQFFWG